MRLGLVVACLALAPLAGCGQGEGSRCQTNSDCQDGLICVLPPGVDVSTGVGGVCMSPPGASPDLSVPVDAGSDFAHSD
jgi:hypothetical protein